MSGHSVSPNVISFDDLISFHKEQSRLNGQSTSFASEKTALKFFQDALGLKGHDNAEKYFVNEAAFDVFLMRLSGRGAVSDSTLKSYKSRLKKLRKSIIYMVKTQIVTMDTIPGILAAVLPQFLSERGLSVTAFAKICGMSRTELQDWRTPGRSAFRITPLKAQRAAKVEEVLGLPQGTLTNKLSSSRHKKYEKNRTEYLASKPCGPITLNRIRYRPATLPPKIDEFFQRLRSWKTSKKVLSRLDGEHLNRNVKTGQTKIKGWRVNENTGKSSTAEKYKNQLRTFYGWLMLPKTIEEATKHIRENFSGPARCMTPSEIQRLAPLFIGKGQKAEDVSVAQFVDPMLQSDFMEWREKRHGKEKVDYVNDARTLLTPDVGFLSQQVEYVWDYAKLNIQPVDTTQSEWEDRYVEACRTWDKKSAQWLRQLTPLVPDLTGAKKRVQRKLEPILDCDDLIAIILKMIERHAESRPQIMLQKDSAGALNLAVWHRDQLLLRMLMSNPLRNRNYREMRYMKNNKGNLYQKHDVEWWIRFNPSDFKNENGAASENYDVPLPHKIWPFINAYVDEARPFLLKGRNDVEQLFVTQLSEPFESEGISSVIASLSTRFMPEEVGAFAIRSHAFRHIIATAWLRSHPEDYLTVALILHDRIQTVIDNYGHIKPADGIKRYNSWLSARLA